MNKEVALKLQQYEADKDIVKLGALLREFNITRSLKQKALDNLDREIAAIRETILRVEAKDQVAIEFNKKKEKEGEK